MSKGLSVIVGVLALLLVGSSLVYVFPTASNQGYAPEQPIPFSHKLHAGDNKIACQYCHADVEKSRHASVPPVATCMNCHRVVKTESPLIQQITKAYNENKPIEWVRVHELPDFAYFPHKTHVGAGVSCQTCHGPVETMEKVYQYGALTMGWCMECHKGRTTPKNVVAELMKRPGYNPHGTMAPVNCTTCHY
jgi:hypothetical protein